MSELYTSSSDARRQTAQIGKTGNFWQDWYTDRVRDGINFNANTGEYDKTGLAFWGGLVGLNNSDAIQGIERGKDTIRDSEKIESTLDRFPGVTEEQLLEASGGQKLTGSNVKGVVSEAVRTREEKPTPLQQGQLELQTQSLQAQTENTKATNERLIKQGEQAHQLALLQLADAQTARVDQLAYQKMRDRKEDMRYNERMEQLDRKDRRTAMSNIAAGLASLGAAFAL